MKKIFFMIIILICFFFSNTLATTYYIDYEDGNNSNNGLTKETAWKHAPGDPRASGNANIILQPGYTVAFKGGVVYEFDPSVTDYISATSSGLPGSEIVYLSGHKLSTPWGNGRAKINGTYADISHSSGFNGVLSLRGHSNIIVDGLEMFDSPWVYYTGLIGWIYQTSHGLGQNITIKDCVLYGNFKDNVPEAIVITGRYGSDVTPKNFTIEGCNISNTGGHGILWRWGLENIKVYNNSAL